MRAFTSWSVVRSRAARVTALVRKTLPRLESLGLGSYDAYSVVATATAVHLGRTSTVHVVDLRDGEGRLVASARVSNSILGGSASH